MKICHVCKAECDDFAEVCAICGAYLVNETEESEEIVSTEVDENLLEEPTLIATFEDVVSAEIPDEAYGYYFEFSGCVNGKTMISSTSFVEIDR